MKIPVCAQQPVLNAGFQCAIVISMPQLRANNVQIADCQQVDPRIGDENSHLGILACAMKGAFTKETRSPRLHAHKEDSQRKLASNRPSKMGD